MGVVVMTLLTVLALSQLAVSLANWFATIFVQPALLPRLDYSEGITASELTVDLNHHFANFCAPLNRDKNENTFAQSEFGSA